MPILVLSSSDVTAERADAMTCVTEKSSNTPRIRCGWDAPAPSGESGCATRVATSTRVLSLGSSG